MKTFELVYKEYYTSCYSSVPLFAEQKAEIRQAFYAGALAVICELLNAAHISKSSAEKRLTEIFKELEDYGEKRKSELDRNS